MEFDYICSECRRRYAIEPHLMVCPDCAKKQEKDQPLRGILEVALTGKAPFRIDIPSLLPVEPRFFPPIPVGDTPLWEPENLRRQWGFPHLYIKDDGAAPTSSFKDRASWLVSAFAKKWGIEEIVLASTGNAGSSMAGIAAAAGQHVTLFLPESAPPAKLVQALQYGATVHRVEGSYDLAYELSLAYSKRHGGMNRNTGYNPMTIEGKKTVSLEFVSRLGKVPDHIFVATGDGCILSGVYKGFEDLIRLGHAHRMPTLHAVQAETSAALHRAFHSGKFENLPTHSVADSICVDVPSNGIYALAHLKRYDGTVLTVADEMIIEAQAALARSTGLFTEPAGAAAYAGFLKVKETLSPDAVIVILATGNGLKDNRTALKGVAFPTRSIRSIDEI